VREFSRADPIGPRRRRGRARAIEHRGIREQILGHVGIEIPEHVPVLLRVEDLVPERAEQRGADVHPPAAHVEVQAAGEIGMGAADDGRVGGGDVMVAVQILELDPPGTRPIVPRYPMERSKPLLLIFPMLMIGGAAVLAAPGVRGSNNRLFELRRYTSMLNVPRPSRASRSTPTFTDRFSSHFSSVFPVAVSLNPGTIDVLVPPMS